MPAYKDEVKSGNWKVLLYYRDSENKKCRKTKRGFQTKKEAQKWETEFKLIKSRELSKTFDAFWKTYKADQKPRVRESTWQTKEHIAETKFLLYFENKSMNEIKPRDIMQWQNQLIQMKTKDGKEYTKKYLKTVQAQLSAVFNHAVKYYDLPRNPVKDAEPMDAGRPSQINFWTKEEYFEFIDMVEKDSMSYYAFEVLYWCGLREGELLALTREDINLKKGQISVIKTYHRDKKADVFTRPKTERSIRVVTMPNFLTQELSSYLEQEQVKKERIFAYTKGSLRRVMKRCIEKAEVKDIRVHDLRHSHVSLLLHLGYSAVAIGERVGHKSERITLYYGHLFPGVKEEIAMRLDGERKLCVNEENSL